MELLKIEMFIKFLYEIFLFTCLLREVIYIVVFIFVTQIRLSMELLKIEMFIKFLYEIFLLTCLLREVICIVLYLYLLLK